jgi:hypothetical protein
MTYEQATELLNTLQHIQWDLYLILFAIGMVIGVLLFKP